jgi:GNAT superfamily N-acetyltransferase
MSVIFRKANEHDKNSMCDMLAALFSIETDFKIDADKHRHGLDLLLRDNESRIAILAEFNFRIAGMITGQLVVSTASGGYSVLIEDLFVMPDFRRFGIAAMLLREIISWGKAMGAVRAQLVADERNKPALALYKKTGFGKGSMTGLYKMI